MSEPVMYAHCFAGDHLSKENGMQFFPDPPPGWRWVKVGADDNGDFKYDPQSTIQVMCCPCHAMRGEPSLN